MYNKSLKKQQKVRLLIKMLGPLKDERCLLITNGDNNGAMNYHFRNAGGRWTWAEVEEEGIDDMAALLGEPVEHISPETFSFPDASFDRLISIDVHEHLNDVSALNCEIARVAAPGGIAIVTTPNGNPLLPVAILKRLVGMGPEQYGHVVQGYRVKQLESMLQAVGLKPEQMGGYSRFFTELAELAINFGYVKVLSRLKKGQPLSEGTVAPGSKEQLKAVEKTYRMYALIYPFVRAFSALDALIPGRGGYAVAVAARKPL
jgi:SAM-dependent methyltransferase